ncbi:MAG: hypothetical protein DHS20C18_02850 [Saprospiraceae bacterium]|nr:MAG: hypothetical protein DHS20C18_02850 [Saprospiraceae bacterium]
MPIYDVVVFVFNEIRRFDLFTRANAIAFSFFLSIFPSLLTLFTFVPFFQKYFLKYLPEGEQLDEFLYSEILKVMPGAAGEELFGFIQEATEPKVGLLSFGFLLAIFFSSNGMLAMMQGFEKSYKTTFRRRNAFKKRLVAISLTMLVGLLLLFAFIVIILGNTLIYWLEQYINLDNFTAIGLEMLRWASILFIFYFGIALLYRYGAATKIRFNYFSPGTTLATVLSILSSLAFSAYVDDFGRMSTYQKFYGSIATIIILMLWLQINSLILLIGFELNSSIAVNRDLKQQRAEEELLA